MLTQSNGGSDALAGFARNDTRCSEKTLRSNMVAAVLVVVAVMILSMGERASADQPEVTTAAAPLRSSPFEAVRWTDTGAPEVMYEGSWYAPISIHGVTATEIVAFCEKSFAEKARKRFEEDLVEVLGKMGHAVPAKIALVLRGVDDGRERTVADAVMSEANRRKIKEAASDREKHATGQQRVVVVQAPGRLSTADARGVIDALQMLLETHHSYTVARAHDPAALLAPVRAEAVAEPAMGIYSSRLLELLNRAIAPIGDGHARVSAEGVPAPAYYLPATLIGVPAHGPGRIAALDAGSRRLLDEDHPFIEAIDDVPMERWLAEAAAQVPSGSTQFVERQALRILSDLPDLRAALGLQFDDHRRQFARFTLVSAAGQSRVLERPVMSRPARRAAFTAPSVPGVTLVRIEKMTDEPEEVARIRSACLSAGTKGLILDLRGNGGGARTLINEIGRLILPVDAPPVVYNAARPMKLPGESAADLRERMDSRFLRPVNDPRWSEPERAAIERFASRFTPELALDDARFHPWHYAVLYPAPADAPRVAGHVVVLMDAGCFSATDIFLCALKELPGVTLLGMPSGGGSGLTRRHELGHGFSVRLSTMVSFRPDGRLLDGHGVAPDELIPPGVADFTTAEDAVFRRAVEVLTAPVKP